MSTVVAVSAGVVVVGDVVVTSPTSGASTVSVAEHRVLPGGKRRDAPVRPDAQQHQVLVTAHDVGHTSVVGRAKLIELGHDVALGTRDPTKLDEKKNMAGTLREWVAKTGKGENKGKVVSFNDAAAHGELLDISTDLSKTLEQDQLLPKIVDRLLDLFKQAERGFVILHELFERAQPASDESEKVIASLHQKIGQLTVDLDWLKKKSRQLGLSLREEN